MNYRVNKNRVKQVAFNPNQKNENDHLNWFRMDNAATLFSLVTSARIPCMYRWSVILKQPININDMQQALENVIERFPYYKVNLRRGFFWYFWEENSEKPKVEIENKYPCKKLCLTKKGTFPFRVQAFNNHVAIEFHHSITDGTGSIIFIKTLIIEYFRLRGIEQNDKDLFKLNERPNEEEYEDAFKKHYQKKLPNPNKISRAFHLPNKLEPKGVYNIITGKIAVEDVIAKSKQFNVTLTEYLIAIYLDSLQELLFDLPAKKHKKQMKPIRLQIPVNLRRFYPSKTMRNFSLYVTPSIDPRLGRYSFEEIINQVYHYMRVEVCDKVINQQIARNVRGESNFLLRITPLFIKKLFGKTIYNNLGEYLYSGVLTNLGKITFPELIENQIEEINAVPAPSPVTKVGCATGSFKETLFITFGRTIKESTLMKAFFTRLVKEGIKVKIETN